MVGLSIHMPLSRLTFSTRRRLLVGLLAITLALGAFWFLPPILSLHPTTLADYSTAPSFAPSERITVVSPHLDDETLGVGGLIATARSQGIPVSIIFMSNGDDFPIAASYEFKTGYATPQQLIEFGTVRQQEAIAAAAKLGIAENQLYFLGLPDRGLDKLFSPAYQSTPYRSLGTLQTASPYARSYIPRLPYTGNAASEALLQAIQETNPTLVLTTTPLDKHKDHAATGEIVTNLLSTQEHAPDLRYFLIHYSQYPRPKGSKSESPLLPPPRLARSLNWQVFPLDASAKQAKTDATNEYRSQLRVPSVGSLLRGMIRSNELLIVPE